MYIGKTWVICWTFGWILVMHVGKYTQVHSRSLSNQGLVWKCHTFQRKLTFINDKSFSRKNVEAPTLCISGAKNGFQWVSLLRRSLSYHIILQKEAGHEQATLTLKAKTTMEAIVLLAVLVSGEATSWINKIDVDHFSGSWFLRDPCGPGDWACTLFASSFLLCFIGCIDCRHGSYCGSGSWFYSYVFVVKSHLVKYNVYCSWFGCGFVCTCSSARAGAACGGECTDVVCDGPLGPSGWSDFSLNGLGFFSVLAAHGASFLKYQSLR